VAELNDSLKQTDELLSSIVKSLTSAEQITKRLEGSMGGVAGKAKSAKGGGDRHIGSGMGSQMPHMGNATFGGHETASNTAEIAMREGMEATRYGLSPTRGAKVLGVAQGVAQASFGVAAGVMAAVPGVAEVGASAANYYGASLGSGMSRRSIMNATFSGLAGGVSSTLSPSNIAGIAASRGITPGSAQYNALVGDVGGAARYMNMANENAMVAMSGLTQGDFSSRLYNIGISTYDSKTGKARGQDEIMGQLYTRLTQGQQKMSLEELNTSFQAGNFGKTATDLGMSSDQRDLFMQYSRDRVQGKQTDLSKLGYGQNPNVDKLRINTSDTSVLNAYTEPVLAGFKSAADLIVNTVNPALENMASVAGKASGFLGGMGESRAGTGIGIAVGGILQGVQTIIAMMAGGAVMSAAGGAAVAGGATAAAAGGAALAAGASAVIATGGGYVVGKGGKILGNALGTSKTVTRAGSTAAGAGAGALIGTAILPGIGTVIGAGFGAIGGYLGSGGGTPGFGASFSSMGGGSASPSSPITNGGVGTPYGATGNLWSGGSHTGQDYPCAIGTPVHASLGGVVINTSPGSDYGKTVEIDHGNGYQTLYGHLSEVLVKVGETVTQGQLIAKSGDTGKVTGPHLHYEVRKGKNNPVNPDELGKAGGSGLAGVLGASGNNATSTNGQPLSSMVGSKSVEDLIGGGLGNLPAELLGNASSSGGRGGSGVILGTGSEKEWATGLLQKMGAPVNDSSINALTTWMRHEGGHWKNSANYNPLNTTLDMSNNESMNSVGVKRYKSWEEGYAATIGTLTGKNAGDRGYTAIVDALKSGASTDVILGAINNSAWMTGKTGQNAYKFQGGGSPSVATLSSSSGMTISPSITINVSVQKASYAEAMNLVEIVKTQLEKENLLRLVGGQ